MTLLPSSVLPALPSGMPLADVHQHLEAAISKEVMEMLAEKRGIPLHEAFRSNFPFQGLPHFLKHYDYLNDLYIRGEEDYTLIAKEYLLRMAKEGAIYCDLISSPAHAANSGLSCEQMIDAINTAIEEAHTESGIRATISLTAVRAPSNLPDPVHAGQFKKYGPDSALKYAQEVAALKQSDPAKCKYLTSFGIAGNESHGDFAEYKPAIDVARAAQLIIRAHAGEVEPGSVRSAMIHLHPEVIDHGLAIAHDPKLMADIAKKRIRITNAAITSNAAGLPHLIVMIRLR